MNNLSIKQNIFNKVYTQKSRPISEAAIVIEYVTILKRSSKCCPN